MSVMYISPFRRLSASTSQVDPSLAQLSISLALLSETNCRASSSSYALTSIIMLSVTLRVRVIVKIDTFNLLRLKDRVSIKPDNEYIGLLGR